MQKLTKSYPDIKTYETMAGAKKEITLRFFLERYLGETGILENINEVTRRILLDSIIQEINDVEEFCEILHKIEKNANPLSKHLELQQFARMIVTHVKLTKEWHTIIHDRDGECVNKEQLQEAFQKVVNRVVEPPQFEGKRRRLA